MAVSEASHARLFGGVMATVTLQVECHACGDERTVPLVELADVADGGSCTQCGAPTVQTTDSSRAVSAADYVLAADRAAMLGLARVPGLVRLVQLFARKFSDDDISLEHYADDLLVSERQLPEVHERYVAAGRRLGFAEDALPMLFINQDPVPSAFTRGVERAVIVMTTGLMDLLDDDEIQAVLGHELGHVQAGHFLYGTALAYADRLGRLISQFTPTVWDNLILGIAAAPAVLAWRRAGEISADRAGLLAAPTPQAMMTVLMKLAGAPPGRIRSVSFDEFAEQAERYESLRTETLVRRIMMAEDILYRGHPFPVTRIGAVRDFIADGDYLKALRAAAAGDEVPYSDPCPHCGGLIADWDIVCRHCAWGVSRVDGELVAGDEPPDEDDPAWREWLADRSKQTAEWVRETAAPGTADATKRAATGTASWIKDRARDFRDRRTEADDQDDNE